MGGIVTPLAKSCCGLVGVAGGRRAAVLTAGISALCAANSSQQSSYTSRGFLFVLRRVCVERLVSII